MRMKLWTMESKEFKVTKHYALLSDTIKKLLTMESQSTWYPVFAQLTTNHCFRKSEGQVHDWQLCVDEEEFHILTIALLFQVGLRQWQDYCTTQNDECNVIKQHGKCNKPVVTNINNINLSPSNNQWYKTLPCTALFMVNIICPLVEILGFVVVVLVGSWKIFC